MVDSALTLRVIRAIVNVTRKEMAVRLGVNVETLHRWERGECAANAKGRAALKKICDDHGISIRADGYPLVG